VGYKVSRTEFGESNAQGHETSALRRHLHRNGTRARSARPIAVSGISVFLDIGYVACASTELQLT